MKAETKAVVASLVVIALALTAVSGVTYSRWSDSENSEISITTGSLYVKTSEYKVTGDSVAYSDKQSELTADKVPDYIAIAISDSASAPNMINLKSSGVDYNNISLTITYTVTFHSDVSANYNLKVTVPTGEDVDIKATAENVTSETPSLNIEGTLNSTNKEKTYNVTITVKSLPQNFNGKISIFNVIAQSGATLATAEIGDDGNADVSSVETGAVTTITGEVTGPTGISGETEKASVSAVFSGMPANAQTFTASYTKNTESGKESVTLSLGLTNSNSVAISETGKVAVTFTVPGTYTTNEFTVVYLGTEKEQPTDVNIVNNGNGTSTVSFTTTHFSDFMVAKNIVAIADIENNGIGAYDTIDNAVEKVVSSGTIVLVKDCTVVKTYTNSTGEYTDLIITKNLTLNLNDKTLSSGYITPKGQVNVTIENGALKCGVWPEGGADVTINNVKISDVTNGVVPLGSKVTINKCDISATAFGVMTNAGSDDNYNVEITINDSIIKGNTAVGINVSKSLTISGSKLYGDRQVLMVRAGMATVTNTELYYGNSDSDASRDLDWISNGNNVTRAAIVVGDSTSDAYKADAKLTLNGVTVIVDETGTAGGKTLVISQEKKDKDDVHYTSSVTLVGDKNSGVLDSVWFHHYEGSEWKLEDKTSDASNKTNIWTDTSSNITFS